MLNIAVCDDNESYSHIIDFKVGKILGDLDIEHNIFTVNSLERFKEICEIDRVDIAFLDICLGEQNAIDWAVENAKSKNTQFIFMTAYPEEAYNLSETEFCYYLVKSKMTDEQLKRAVIRALAEITNKEERLFLFKSGDKNITVNIQKVIYAESDNNNIVIHGEDNFSAQINLTLKAFVDLCPPNFVRCHKSYAVNMNYIKGCNRREFIMKDGSGVPIPPKRYKAVVKRYKDYLTEI